MNMHAILRAQYRATLAMLKQAIERCPPELWNAPHDRNKFWHVAYHALFYTRLYLSTRLEDHKPWEGHRNEYEFLGSLPWPPHDPPKIGDPYSQEEMLAFFEVCWNFVDEQVPNLDLEAVSGFPWLPFNKLELQIYNIRHTQQHIGELMERLGQRADTDVDWQGSIS